VTANVARRSRRRTPAPPPEVVAPTPTESLAIGEINQTVFECPKCARPLAIGVRRCPRCGTHLVLGVPLAKVSAFISLGLILGIAVGVTISFGLNIARAATVAPAVGAMPSLSTTPGGGGTVPTASPTTAPSPSPTSDIPPMSRSALTQAIGVNGRLGAGADALRAALAAHDFDASSVAETLRSLAADSVFGQQLVPRLADWPGSAALSGSLGGLYDSVHQTATDWLVASVRDETAYREAAAAMLKVLKGLTAVDAEANALAGRIGLPVAPSAAP
jgi:hypothetical protein